MDQAQLNVNSGVSPIQKRNLRKGTHSCVECKRRKTRCFSDGNSPVSCVGCQRRGTACISQELVDIATQSRTEEPIVGQRLDRIEKMLKKITQAGMGDAAGAGAAQQNGGSGSGQSPIALVQAAEDRMVVAGEANFDDSHGRAQPDRDTAEAIRALSITNVYSQNQAAGASQSPRQQSYPTAQPVAEYDRVGQTLYAALPSQQAADILFEAGRASIFLQVLLNSYNELFNESNIQSASLMATLPPATSHPVMLARKLLQLALCIQQLDPSFDQNVLQLTMPLKDAKVMYVDLASNWVTCHDKLLNTLEGLECLVYESTYLVNAGHLRQAWFCVRRASSLAQFMGLHRPSAPRTLKQLDPATKFSCTVAWAHIVYLERYLSLLLGMPTGIVGKRFTSEEKQVSETHSEWLEKVHSDIFERIIERSQNSNYIDSTTIQHIDHDLQCIASNLPSKWWTPMEVRPGMDVNDIMSRVISGQSQIVHYNLLALLHLPYLLCSPRDRSFDYSKTTCMYASREVLNRFIAFRAVVRIVFCCRFVDFCALTAALSLLLGHLNSHGGAEHQLTHQRLGDRALIENVIETLDELNRVNDDGLSQETARLARKLLDLEAGMANGGGAYNGCIAEGNQDDCENGEFFNLIIPYFGTVKVSRDPVAQSQYLTTPATSWQTDLASTNTASTPLFFSPAQQQPIASSSSMTPSSGLPSYNTPFELTSQHQHLPAGEQFPPHLMVTELTDDQFELPELMAGLEGWAFQGVDSVFFNSVISGYAANRIGGNGD